MLMNIRAFPCDSHEPMQYWFACGVFLLKRPAFTDQASILLPRLAWLSAFFNPRVMLHSLVFLRKLCDTLVGRWGISCFLRTLPCLDTAGLDPVIPVVLFSDSSQCVHSAISA
jgi:hypothetical protein